MEFIEEFKEFEVFSEGDMFIAYWPGQQVNAYAANSLSDLRFQIIFGEASE